MKLGTKVVLSILGAFVLVVAWLAYDSQREQTGLGDIRSREPDGWYVLAELLRSEGYVVQHSRSIPAPSDDVLVVSTRGVYGMDEYSGHPNRILLMEPGERFRRIRRTSRDRVYDPQRSSDSIRSQVRVVTNDPENGETFSINGVSYGSTRERDLVSAFTDGGSAYAYRTYRNWLEYTVVPDTTFTQNRWIDQHDNAAFILTIFRSNLEPGGRIVFVDAPYPTVFTALGPWSRASMVIFFVLVGMYLLGSRRFSKAYPREPKVQSSKDLIYAMSNMLRQADHAGFAMQRVLDYDLAELKRQLRLPSHATEDTVLSQLPPDIVKGYIQARGSSNEKNPSRVLRILKEWRRSLAQFQTGVR